jgi:hypothetical protein
MTDLSNAIYERHVSSVAHLYTMYLLRSLILT